MLSGGPEALRAPLCLLDTLSPNNPTSGLTLPSDPGSHLTRAKLQRGGPSGRARPDLRAPPALGPVEPVSLPLVSVSPVYNSDLRGKRTPTGRWRNACSVSPLHLTGRFCEDVLLLGGTVMGGKLPAVGKREVEDQA